MDFEDDLALRANDKKMAAAFLQFESATCPIMDTIAVKGAVYPIPDGVIRRVFSRDPSELVRAIFFHNRRVWNTYANASKRNRYHDSFWREILYALLIKDSDLVSHLLEHLPPTGMLSYRDPDRLIYEVAHALASGDYSDEERTKIRDKSKRSHISFFRSIIDCLDAICAADAQAVASSIAKTNAALRKSHCGEENKFICVESHGLWALANRIHPDLVRLYDTTSHLPWDRGLHHYIETFESPMELIDVDQLNDELRDLITLKLPGEIRM